MVFKKKTKKKVVKKKVISKKRILRSSKVKKKVISKNAWAKKIKKPSSESKKVFPTLRLKTEKDIAMDFAVKVTKKFNKIIKSVILFGSTTKQDQVAGSDIDIVIILDDVTIVWNQELIAWYRAELDKILKVNPYAKNLHINTVKLSTWWEDLLRGDPVIINILRYGEAMVDMAGFFNPIKALLLKGKIKATPEAIYSSLQRAPAHIARSKAAELTAVEGLYWSMVDSAHAALIAVNRLPPSPEHVAGDLNELFVSSGLLKAKYVEWYKDILVLHKKISHGKIHDLKGVSIDILQNQAEEFLEMMAKIVNKIVR
jgi:predicted nucleotidyltransferase/uncharacterized protein (UPF0332 family)